MEHDPKSKEIDDLIEQMWSGPMVKPKVRVKLPADSDEPNDWFTPDLGLFDDGDEPPKGAA